jgi:hypothetical protein
MTNPTQSNPIQSHPSQSNQINGVSVKDLKRDSLRSAVAVVPQVRGWGGPRLNILSHSF